MKTVKLIIEYDGTNFYGWQRQSDKRSIQGSIEKVLTKIYKETIQIDGAGRTDAGVHAYGQVATYKEIHAIPLENIKRAVNNFLDSDIRIVALEYVDDSFHARYSAIGKTYVYKIHNTVERSVFLANKSDHYPYMINDNLVLDAISYLIGEHNFGSFMASGSSAQNPIRTIHDITFSRSGDEIEITFTGNGFLYKMVRILTGYLLEVGQGHIDAHLTPELLENPTRLYTSKIAPACGLYLKEVYYE